MSTQEMKQVKSDIKALASCVNAGVRRKILLSSLAARRRCVKSDLRDMGEEYESGRHLVD